MKESREFEITNRRFRRADLEKIANVLVRESERCVQNDIHHQIQFTLRCLDKTTYSSPDPNIFQEGSEIDIKPPSSVEFDFFEYDQRNKISLSLVHGGFYRDSLIVSGGDREWVRSIFTEITEILNSVDPSTSFFTNHPEITGHLTYLGWGAVINFGIQIIFLYLLPDSALEYIKGLPEPTGAFWTFLKLPYIFFIFDWSVKYFSGMVLGGSSIHSWLLNAWPSIDLDVGPNHMRTFKMQRARIKFFFASILLPLTVSLVLDLIKKL